MKDFPAKRHCDRCGAKPARGRLFRIPWTGDLLCKDCIDKDSSIQQLFAEINSLTHDRRRRYPGSRTDRPDGVDLSMCILEPDDQ